MRLSIYNEKLIAFNIHEEKSSQYNVAELIRSLKRTGALYWVSVSNEQSRDRNVTKISYIFFNNNIINSYNVLVYFSNHAH